MKKGLLIYMFISLAICLSSCKNDKENNKIIEQQALIENLKNENRVLQGEINKLRSEKEVSEPSSTNSSYTNIAYEQKNTGNQEQAKSAIRSYMESYHSGVEYDNIKAVNKTDGTVDIILDIITHDGSDEIWLRNKKYFNVSTYFDETYRINREWGIVL
jgi:hypothetical protein